MNHVVTTISARLIKMNGLAKGRGLGGGGGNGYSVLICLLLFPKYEFKICGPTSGRFEEPSPPPPSSLGSLIKIIWMEMPLLVGKSS